MHPRGWAVLKPCAQANKSLSGSNNNFRWLGPCGSKAGGRAYNRSSSYQVLFLYKPNLIRFWKSSSSDRIVRWFFFVHVNHTNSHPAKKYSIQIVKTTALHWNEQSVILSRNMSGLNFMKETLTKFRTVKKCTIRKNGNGSYILWKYICYLFS